MAEHGDRRARNHADLAASQPPTSTALKMLARRELSEQQVRQRLARKGHDPTPSTTPSRACASERAIDDARVAEAIARTETDPAQAREGARADADRARRHRESDREARRRRGRSTSIDDDALLEASLAKRLRGRDTIADDREFQRLYRYLVSARDSNPTR